MSVRSWEAIILFFLFTIYYYIIIITVNLLYLKWLVSYLNVYSITLVESRKLAAAGIELAAFSPIESHTGL